MSPSPKEPLQYGICAPSVSLDTRVVTRPMSWDKDKFGAAMCSNKRLENAPWPEPTTPSKASKPGSHAKKEIVFAYVKELLGEITVLLTSDNGEEGVEGGDDDEEEEDDEADEEDEQEAEEREFRDSTGNKDEDDAEDERGRA